VGRSDRNILDMIGATILCLFLASPLALAWRAWPRDRARLGGVRRRLTFAALLLSTASWTFVLLFTLRMYLVHKRVSFPENLHDWAWHVARFGGALAVVAVPVSFIGVGQTRVFAVLGAMLQWLWIAFAFASV
jgi:hypothetical protein